MTIVSIKKIAITFFVLILHCLIFIQFDSSTKKVSSPEVISNLSKNSVEINIKNVTPKIESKEGKIKEKKLKQSTSYGIKNPPKINGLLNPKYPHLSRVYKEEGKVVLSLNISSEGIPSNIVIKDSSGFKRLDEEALKSVMESEFTPALNESNSPVSSNLELEVVFLLN